MAENSHGKATTLESAIAEVTAFAVLAFTEVRALQDYLQENSIVVDMNRLDELKDEHLRKIAEEQDSLAGEAARMSLAD